VNLLLFDAADVSGPGLLQIGGERLHHLRTVQAMLPGQTLRIGEIDGLLGSGEVLDINANSAQIRYALERQPPPKLPLTLVVALPRPKMLRRIVRTVAECGVRSLHLIHSYRVQRSYWQSPVLAADTLRRYLLEGLSQSIDTVVPTVHQHRRFRPFVEDLLPTLIGGGAALLAQPGASSACPGLSATDRVCVIGPEGGFIPFEVDLLTAAGCQPVSLGLRILRVDTALPVLLGRLGAGDHSSIS